MKAGAKLKKTIITRSAGEPLKDGLTQPHYRSLTGGSDLVRSHVRQKQSNLLIKGVEDLTVPARAALKRCRRDLEDYFKRFPTFRDSMFPQNAETGAPFIIREMAEAARICGVGPMAAVAGAVAGCVGRQLEVLSPEIIVENGGDIYIKCRRERIIAIYPGKNHPFWGKIGLLIKPEDTPLGVATSSGSVGPSLSWGKTDAAVVTAQSSALADAAATALANRLYSAEKSAWERAENFLQRTKGLIGSVVILGDKTMVWGEVELVKLA